MAFPPTSAAETIPGSQRFLRAIGLSVLLVGLAALCVWLWRIDRQDPLAAWRQFPRTYLPAGTVTADPSKVVIIPGGPESPPEIRQDGRVLHPAYVHTERKAADGRPLIFAIATTADGQRTTPPLPPQNTPLDDRQLAEARRYQTAEGEALMVRFREEMAP